MTYETEYQTETKGCGECDSCLAGYSGEYCTEQNALENTFS